MSEADKMRHVYAFPLAVLTALILFGAASAEGQEDKPLCSRCDDKGWLPCKSHPKNVYEVESVAIHCSEVIRCKKCGGTLKVPCPKCGKGISQELVAEREANLQWLEKMRKIDEHMKSRNIMHCESEHFILTYNIPRISPGNRSYKTHGGMHLYLERLEELYDEVKAELGVKDEDFLAKTHVMMWERESEIIRSAAKYCRQDSNTKSYLLGAAPIFTIYYNKGFLHEEYELHQAVTHNVVHCLLSNVWDGIWPGNIKGGWLDAGYAHHHEMKFKQYGGGVRNYCYREGDTNVRFKFGKWGSSVRKAVEKDETPSFLELSSKNIDMLEPPDHMFSWSYVDFVLKRYPDAFGPIAKGIKKRKHIGEVLKETLNMSPFQFEELWKVYVKETYSTKETPWGKPVNRRRR